MRISFVIAATAFLSMPACAQETEIENNMPVSAEATTDATVGQEPQTATPTPATAAAKAATPDRIYTDGALDNPNAKAEDLGLASPGNKTMIDAR